jgi:hypothetical protein
MKRKLAILFVALLGTISAFGFTTKIVHANSCSNSSPLLAQATQSFTFASPHSTTASVQLTIRGTLSKNSPSTDCIWGNLTLTATGTGDSIYPDWGVQQGFYHGTPSTSWAFVAYAEDDSTTTIAHQVGINDTWLSGASPYGSDCVLINDEVSDDSHNPGSYATDWVAGEYSVETFVTGQIPDIATDACPT